LSIYKHTKDVEFEIIVSDNGSTDGSVEMIQLEFPKIIIVKNFSNIGFGAANNRGSKRANGKYIFFLNSDTVLKNNALLLLFNFIENNTNIIAGCFLRDIYGNIIHSYDKFSTPIKSFIRLAYYSFPIFREIKLIFLKDNLIPYEKNHFSEVPYITGADIFISKKAFDELGGFDENFFMYFEDDDLCRRAKMLGYKSYIISDPEIVHLEGASSKNISLKLSFMEKSYLYYMKKYNNKYMFIFIKAFFVLYAFIRFISPRHNFHEKVFLLRSLINA
jgi:GT2 family glycosyltransferase